MDSNSTQTCKACWHPYCHACRNAEENSCTACKTGWYLRSNDKYCVVASNCGEAKFANEATLTCDNCD